MRSFRLFGNVSSVPSQPKRKRGAKAVKSANQGVSTRKCSAICLDVGSQSITPKMPSIKKDNDVAIGRRFRNGVSHRKQKIPDEIIFAIVDLRAKGAKIREIEAELDLTRNEIRRAYRRMGLHLK